MPFIIFGLIVLIFIIGIHVSIEDSKYYKRVFNIYFTILIIGLSTIFYISSLNIWKDELGIGVFLTTISFIIVELIVTFIIALFLRFTEKKS